MGGLIYDHINSKILDATYFDSDIKQELYDYTLNHTNTWLCASTLEYIYDVLVYDKRDEGCFDIYRPKMSYDKYVNGDITKIAFIVKEENMSTHSVK